MFESQSEITRNLILSYCELKQNGQVPKGRAGCRLCAIDNLLYLYGGATEEKIYDDMYSIDFGQVNWKLLSVSGFIKPQPRFGHSFTKWSKEIIMFGGFVHDEDSANSTNNVHNPPPFMPKISKAWSNLGKPSRDLFLFRPSDTTWNNLEAQGDIPPPIAFHASALVQSQTHTFLFVHGGILDPQYIQPTNELYILHLDGLVWMKVEQSGEVPCSRYGHAMVTYPRAGVILMFGGAEDNGSIFALDIKKFMSGAMTNTVYWKKLKVAGTAPISRTFHSVEIIGDRIFVYGGMTATGISDLYILEILKQKWSRPLYDGDIDSMSHGSVAFNDKLIIFGGAGRNPAISNTNYISQKLYFLNVLEIKEGATDAGWKFKIVILGDSGVGKSCLLTRFTQDVYGDFHVSTLGVDLKSIVTMIKGKRCTIQLWDTAGQERFSVVTGGYYRNANAFVMVFDATNRKSFNRIVYWTNQVKEFHPFGQETVKLLIGNKSDLTEQIEVSEEEAQKLSEEIGATYISTSAKSAANVDSAFLTVASQMVEKRQANINIDIQSHTSRAPIQLDAEPGPDSQSRQSQNCVCNPMTRAA